VPAQFGTSEVNPAVSFEDDDVRQPRVVDKLEILCRAFKEYRFQEGAAALFEMDSQHCNLRRRA
jgi:hypothetical protein